MVSRSLYLKGRGGRTYKKLLGLRDTAARAGAHSPYKASAGHCFVGEAKIALRMARFILETDHPSRTSLGKELYLV